MIKINKTGGYLIVPVLTVIIYFIGQLFFFINTEKAAGKFVKSGNHEPQDVTRADKNLFMLVLLQKII